jgi:reductive dehalogenase
MIEIVNWILLALTSGFLLLLLVSSMAEKEKRAAFISFLALCANTGLWVALILYYRTLWGFAANTVMLLAVIFFGGISLVKFFPGLGNRCPAEIEPFDERDHMFSRSNLKFHPRLAKKYYASHPEKREVDRRIHEKPEIGAPGGRYYNEYYSPAFDAAFGYLYNTRGAALGEPAKEKKEIDPVRLVDAIEKMAFLYDVADVGVTPLKPYHLYSHAGRHADTWGKKIENGHRTAIVFVVPMELAMIKAAPSLPVTLESSRQYVKSAAVANVIAQYIRSFGYDARAHTDGNYDVLCVPLAVDAGVGALGRMGILVHPVYGPCVRVSAVTTELELPTLKKIFCLEPIEHFCNICKKCSDNCPSQAICKEKEPYSRGVRHWSINQESCFSYWRGAGTDCGFCIRVCPYTKPDTLVHRLVRFYISRNSMNQRIALFMDDLLYGRRFLVPPAARGRF